MEETINERIRKLRKKLGYTQEYVAKQIGEKTSTYPQMERKGNITCEMLIKLIDVLSTDALTVLYGEEDKEESQTLSNPEEIMVEPIDTYEIQPLVAQNVYEKIAVISMRAFPEKIKQEIYGYIINKLKNIGKLKL